MSVRKYLNNDRKGAMTFEWGVTCPVMMLVMFIVIFMFLMIISYVNYSSLASNVASSMNFRSTGIENAKSALPASNGGLDVAETKLNHDGTIASKSWLNKNLIRVNGKYTENDYKKTVYYYLNQHAGQVFFPFCRLDDKDETGKANKNLTKQDTRTEISANQHADVPYFMNVETFRMTGDTTAKRVELTASKKTAANYANVLVKCDVKYHFFPVYIVGYTWPGMTIYATGYSILT